MSVNTALGTLPTIAALSIRTLKKLHQRGELKSKNSNKDFDNCKLADFRKRFLEASVKEGASEWVPYSLGAQR